MSTDDSHDHSSGHDSHSGFHDHGDDFYDDFHDDGSHGIHSHGSHGHGFRRGRRGRVDLSTAPPWVKVLVWVGALTAFAGVALVFTSLVGGTTGPEPGFGTVSGDSFPGGGLPAEGFPGGGLPAEGLPGGARVTVEGQVFDLADGRLQAPAQSGRTLGPAEETGTAGLGFGLFFVGFVLAAIAAIGHSVSRRR